MFKNLYSEKIKNWSHGNTANSECSSDFPEQSKENTCEESSCLSSEDTPQVVKTTIFSEDPNTSPPVDSTKSGNNVASDSKNLDAIHAYFDIKYDSVLRQSTTPENVTNKATQQLLNQTDTNFTDNTKILDQWTKKDEFTNLHDLEKLFKDDTDKKFDKFFELDLQKLDQPKSKPSGCVKPKSIGAKKKVPHVKLVDTVKPKFEAKKVKGGQDCPEAPRKSPEIESWIARGDSGKKPNYLDFLSEIEEFSNTGDGSKESKMEVDEKVSTAGSLDDIVSILETLENEDKKSRKCFLVGLLCHTDVLQYRHEDSIGEKSGGSHFKSVRQRRGNTKTRGTEEGQRFQRSMCHFLTGRFAKKLSGKRKSCNFFQQRPRHLPGRVEAGLHGNT